MIYVKLFLAFLIPGILGYGGGPASIPLIQNEVVDRYKWVTNQEFSEALAFGNALPGPIATKIAGYIGYEVGGVFGSVVGLFATVAPSLLLMLILLKILMKYKESPKVKRLTSYVRPTIAVLLGAMAYDFFFSSYEANGSFQTIGLAVVSFLLLERFKVSAPYVIIFALAYGAVFLR
jgi:chromate transporter